ncbi:MAG: hypothetical protein ACKVTZ_06870, partial [Bacteroidia bacterium]
MNRYLLIMSVLTCFWACKTTQKTSQTQKVETKTSTQTSTSSSSTSTMSSSQTWKMPDFLAQKVKQADENSSIRIQHFVAQGQSYYGYTSCFTCPDNMVQIYNEKGENKANCGGIAGFK